MKQTILTLVILALLSLASTAQAGEPASKLTLDINVASNHTQHWARRELNQRNPGLGLTYHFDRTWSFAGGAYWNSYRRPSAYALAQWTPLQFGAVTNWHIDAGLAAGLATGYRKSEIAVRPFAGGALVRVVSPSGASINVFGVPGTGGGKSGFLGFQFSFPL